MKYFFIPASELFSDEHIDQSQWPQHYTPAKRLSRILESAAQDIEFTEVSETCSGHECTRKRTGKPCITCSNQNNGF